LIPVFGDFADPASLAAPAAQVDASSAPPRIAKRRKEVNVAFHLDLAIVFRRCLHFGGRVMPRQ
jgi:hypothetical protein